MKHFKRWGAVWILMVMFLGSWAGQFLQQLEEVHKDAKTHGEQFMWSDFWPQFWSATFENWQSEFLQLAVQTVLIASILAKYTFAADNGADKDDVDKIMTKLNSMDKKS